MDVASTSDDSVKPVSPEGSPSGGSNTSLLDRLTDAVRPPSRVETSREERKDLVKEFVGQVLAGSMTIARDAESMILARIAQIDHLVCLQLNAIMHSEAFRALEASWRGLDYLVRRTWGLEGVKIRVLNASKKRIASDFNQVPEFRRAAATSRILEDTLETFGGEPFSVLIGSYSFGPDFEDQRFLEWMGKLASMAHAPFLAAASPEMFGGSLATIPHGATLTRVLESTSHDRWNWFRSHPEASYVALVLPSVLMRKPFFREDCRKAGAFCFVEDYEDVLPWGSPVWALASQLAKSFSETSWCAELHALEDGAVMRKLPSFEEYRPEGDIGKRGPAELFIGDSLRRELCRWGFIPLCADQKDGRAAFFETPTMRRLPRSDEFDEDAVPPPPLDRLEYMFASARVAQYVKCIVREKQSSWRSVAECEAYLNQWAAKWMVPAGAPDNSPAGRQPFLSAHFRVVKYDRYYYNYRVEGELMPNLRVGGASTPIPVVVDIVLPVSMPASREVAVDSPERVASAGPPAATSSFAAASESLAQLAELKRKQLIDDTEFQQLHNLLLSRMKEACELAPQPATPKVQAPASESRHLDPPVPYARLHAQIVQRVAESYQAGEDPKYRAYRAMAEMAERQALAPGDSEPLSRLIDTTLAGRPETPSDLDRRAAEVKSISTSIASREGASPAARAIAETAEQSVEKAADWLQKSQTAQGQNGSLIERAWRKLVWPDVEGAFSGGAAAASVLPAFSNSLSAVPMPVIAALGVVIGAGIRSGVAYGEVSESTRKKTRLPSQA
jgi:type VI secretion system protein ImpC